MEYTNVERIIAKIDNDFNPNNSDWIPRVGAWVHDALSQLQVNQYETVSKKLQVTNGIVRSCNELPNDIKVRTKNIYGIYKRLNEIQEKLLLRIFANKFIAITDLPVPGPP